MASCRNSQESRPVALGARELPRGRRTPLDAATSCPGSAISHDRPASSPTALEHFRQDRDTFRRLAFTGGAMKHFTASAIFLAVVAAASAAWSQNVKVTPLGSHAGELCVRDRATIFEDPSGVRILYDAGQSVTGADDPRLGKIDVVILSHAHGDHIGDLKLKALESGTCATPEVVSAAPNSTTGEIVAAKNRSEERRGGKECRARWSRKQNDKQAERRIRRAPNEHE